MPKAVHNSSKMVREPSETRQKHSKAVQHGSKFCTQRRQTVQNVKKKLARAKTNFLQFSKTVTVLGGWGGSGGTIFSESLTVGGEGGLGGRD